MTDDEKRELLIQRLRERLDPKDEPKIDWPLSPLDLAKGEELDMWAAILGVPTAH